MELKVRGKHHRRANEINQYIPTPKLIATPFGQWLRQIESRIRQFELVCKAYNVNSSHGPIQNELSIGPNRRLNETLLHAVQCSVCACGSATSEFR